MSIKSPVTFALKKRENYALEIHLSVLIKAILTMSIFQNGTKGVDDERKLFTTR
jgi:hypothetical protein